MKKALYEYTYHFKVTKTQYSILERTCEVYEIDRSVLFRLALDHFFTEVIPRGLVTDEELTRLLTEYKSIGDLIYKIL